MYKLIKQIKTDVKEPGEPKDPDNSNVFQLYNYFADEQQSLQMREKFVEGIGWGDAKKELFELVDSKLAKPREEYNRLMNDLGHVESVLLKGAEKARQSSAALMDQVRKASGIRPLTYVPPKAEQKVKKEKSSEQQLKAEQGRKRGILMQLKSVLEVVANSEDTQFAATQLIAQKEAAIESLKNKAKDKAVNELEVLKEELAQYF